MKVQSEPLPGEEAWIPSPVEPDLLWPRRKIFGGDATWTAYRGKTHQACSTCIEVLIEHEKEPYPRPPGARGTVRRWSARTGRSRRG
jgi:hypothetical protein